MAKKKKEEVKINNIDELRSFMKGADMDFFKDPRASREILSTGFYSLDHLLKGGLRGGTYVELYGAPSAGKTYLALNFMKSCQENWKKPVCYIDFERAWDPSRAEEIGVNLDQTMCQVVEPPTQEVGYDFLHAAIKNDIFGVIVIDSMSAMVPFIEWDEKMEQEQVAKGARVNSKGLRVITSGLKNTVVIFINQLRENIGVMYGDTKTTTGGNSLSFYAHMRLECARLVREQEERDLYSAKVGGLAKTKVSPGHILKVRFKKSKMGNAEKFCELVYDYDIGGVDKTEDVKTFLFENGKLVKDGMFYDLEGQDKRIKGKQALYDFLQSNEEFVTKLVNEIKN